MARVLVGLANVIMIRHLDTAWYMDSGVLDHMTYDFGYFT